MGMMIQESTDSMNALAHKVFDRQFLLMPDMVKEYDERKKRLMFEDILYNLGFLDAALRLDEEKVLRDYAVWLFRLLFHLFPNPDRVRIRNQMNLHYRILAEEIAGVLPEEMGRKAAQFLEGAIQATSEEAANPTEGRSYDTGSHAGIRTEFLAKLLSNDTRGAHETIDRAILSGVPLDQIYVDIIQEVMVQIGDLWHTNQVSVDKEHYCTSTTQVILSGFYSTIFSTPRNGGKILACCVGSELHEMGIRMVSDMFEYHGWDSLYLGAAVPNQSILHAIGENRPDLVALSVTMPTHLPLCLEIVQSIRKLDPTIRIAVGGRAFETTDRLWERWPVDVHTENARELVEWADQEILGRCRSDR